MTYQFCLNCTNRDACFNNEEEYEELLSALMNLPNEMLGRFFLENGCGRDFQDKVNKMRHRSHLNN
ncbi:hypothetical protein [Vibrio gigantis]|uniref:hypothetical protein n=1 Tax=Vibrio gigantis TaxID=296199 RepID=UPI001BFE301F|nr:hypothetical protein [Vibrio gigantis]